MCSSSPEHTSEIGAHPCPVIFLWESRRKTRRKVVSPSNLGACKMKTRSHGIEGTISLAVLAFGLASSLQGQGLHNPAGVASALNNAWLQEDHDDQSKKTPTPPGLYITPKALADALQQDLNPGLAKYPDFVAGQAQKAVASPDGKTLAILTAGMNSLYDSTGVIDTAASTQFL